MWKQEKERKMGKRKYKIVRRCKKRVNDKKVTTLKENYSQVKKLNEFTKLLATGERQNT